MAARKSRSSVNCTTKNQCHYCGGNNRFVKLRNSSLLSSTSRIASGRQRLWLWVCQGSRWVLRELGSPLLCFICVYLGIISSTILLSHVPSTVDLKFLALNMAGINPSVLSPLAALAPTAYVFDVRAYARWRKGYSAPLFVRVIRAYSDGVLWIRWCRPVRRGKRWTWRRSDRLAQQQETDRGRNQSKGDDGTP